MKTIKIFKSTRNNDKLSYDGYLYNKRKEAGEIIFWRCVDRKWHGSGRSEHELFVFNRTHNHPPNYLSSEAAQIKSKIKNRAINTLEKPKDIIKISFLVNSNNYLLLYQKSNQ
jgi:hypothetical protein